ncbi:hypothetical protein JTE90_025873 [Oedothorax gibbosus]|uniref:Hormone receptor 4 n=1 Tax=Oedothorax gibbosus TaxID=931172 RepID=A0AAV6UNK3_9ARAC|nr:hypothetical protein JTE90_025873 [Oedothorax gibbosus]
MIAVGGWCRISMTLFHHLKLKRPRMNSADGMSIPRKRITENGTDPAKEPDLGPDIRYSKGEGPDSPPPACSPSPEDSEAMPQLERQNSVFDGGGTEGVLPHLSPQLWPPSNTLSYHRHFDEDPPPPPLLMGGKTMVWTGRGNSKAPPPSSTVTSPSPPPSKNRLSPPSPSSQHLESAQALLSMYRQSPGGSFRPSRPSDEDSTPASASSSSASVSPDTQALNLCVASTSRLQSELGRGEDEQGQQNVCMICEDRATGLHYGIITCEGCKGFFKRTVQNKRVYTCVADGNCEVTKAQRNRCQYCRFQKCVRQGMVLAAVREDRMPGGRNSGAVYNLYKVKYKKHRRTPKNGHIPTSPTTTTASLNSNSNSAPSTTPRPLDDWPSPPTNGTILKAALTSNPETLLHLRNPQAPPLPTLPIPIAMSPEAAAAMIRPLVECDAFEEVARLRNAKELIQCKLEMNAKLCTIGDNIVFKLVQWTKRLPFYHELPVALHTQMLTHKWHELLVLTACAFLAIKGGPGGGTSSVGVSQAVANALSSLKECLTIMVGEPVGLDELEEAGSIVERLARLADSFRRMGLCMEEYVCLKVIIMQSSDEIKEQKELGVIHDRYMRALQVFVEHRFPNQPDRFQELLSIIPEVQHTAKVVVQSKMFYVPLFLNTTLRSNDPSPT